MNHSSVVLVLIASNLIWQIIRVMVGKGPNWVEFADACWYQSYAVFLCWYFKWNGMLK